MSKYRMISFTACSFIIYANCQRTRTPSTGKENKHILPLKNQVRSL